MTCLVLYSFSCLYIYCMIIIFKQAVLDPLVSMETGQAAKSHVDFGGGDGLQFGL